LKGKIVLFDKTWFTTITCFKWIPLFEITNSYDLVYNWHNLIKSMISNAKRFIAYEIVKWLKEAGH
jgi:hypothetical protein